RQSCDYYLNETILQKDIISSPAELLRYCRASMAALPNEQFRVIHLNAKNEIIHHEVIQEGTIDQTAVYPRKIMEHALKHKAVALIFVHNHPSGSPDPSAHDKRLTRTLVSTAEPLGITVHDHIIIAKNGYFSFNESGLL
ncbi:MAG: DNA repair protein RadC, partial [bacterium]|nr:DNA repair protein RadC [bacterium]MCP4627606.1 DNA repair protein RadC [bacterium]